MLNVIRVFASDAKRLYTNVVAVVVIIGLSVIPSLYAWFNILSNWAPYEKEATSHLSVAVASDDVGCDLDGVELNVGQKIVDSLKENDSINWVFLDNSHEAISQVESGECYAALVISEDFSENMLSFLGGNVEHPKIIYYENEKKNAIAPKITGKVKTTVQEQVNKAFVNTLASSLLTASDYMMSEDNNRAEGLTNGALTKLYRLNNDLKTVISLLDSYISIMDASESLMEAASSMGDEMDAIEENSRAMMEAADASLSTSQVSLDAVSQMVVTGFDTTDKQLENTQVLIREIIGQIEKTGEVSSATSAGLKAAIDGASASFNTATTGMTDPKVDEVKTDLANLSNDVTAVQNAGNMTAEDAKASLKAIDSEIGNVRATVTSLKTQYQTSVDPSVDNTITQIGNSLNEVRSILKYSGGGVDQLAGILGSYPDMMAMGKDNLTATRNSVAEMQRELQALIDDMEAMGENEQYQMLLQLLETDPAIIADFVSSPIDINQQNIYAIENNGSATAPFYIILSIWVGALILVAIVHTKVKEVQSVENLTTAQEFFGRYLVFFMIGQLQTVITVFGALYFTGIQCQHKFLFWLACSFTSFTFTLFLYALAYAFEAVGEAVAVVLMVLQVAGSGGTFPVEVLPRIYQLMYNYMPFAYGMNAVRECIAGMYKLDYLKYMSGLLIYIVLALIIGLVISVPCKKLNESIKESTEKTDLLI